jgi:MFS family permease
MLAIAAVITGLGVGLSGLARAPWEYALVYVLWTFGELGFSPVTPTLVADLAPAELRGSYQGVIQLTFSVAACMAPGVGSLVLGRLGAPWLWGGCLGISMLAAALHLAIVPARRRRLVELGDAGALAREDGPAPLSRARG